LMPYIGRRNPEVFALSSSIPVGSGNPQYAVSSQALKRASGDALRKMKLFWSIT
jgi:hypothetical protein